ncbi:MAG: TatD family hydrolase [Tannerellaceae bacterium]|jgi:TatD DNase family protein|nr:TatD family hydrolase [Tannerellaceae bacterium]
MTAYCNIHTHDPSPAGDIAIVNTSPDDPPSDERPQWISVGIHPWHIRHGEEQWERLERAVDDPRVVAIGEAGLDKPAQTPMDRQLDLFTRQALLAEERHKPLIIHCVKASMELIAVKKRLNPAMPWVIHGFRGKGELASQLVRQGFYLSFGRYSDALSLAAAWPGRLFLETDDREACIREVYRLTASALRLPPEALVPQVRENVHRVFSI